MNQYGETVASPRTGKPGRPRKPSKQWPSGSAFATVRKTYRKGRVQAIERTLVHGTMDDLVAALEASTSSDQINTSFVERQNGTDRTYNARKRRKTYEFSKDLLVHVAVSWWVALCYNFHHLHRGLRQNMGAGSYRPRTPAMAMGIAERPLTVEDILVTQMVAFMPSPPPAASVFRRRRTPGPAP